MAKSIGLITHQYSVVVKSMEKGLAGHGYAVTMFEDDIEKIKLSADEMQAFVLYLHDSMLGNLREIKWLVLLCDTIRDLNRKMIVIGSVNSKEDFAANVPAILASQWFSRPVDMPELIKEIENEINEFELRKEKKKILIIDDDVAYAKMIGEWLKDSYHVDSVSDGMLGISWLATHEVDLILLDYEMPVVDGPKILEMLRMHSDTASIPVMFLTGIGTKESIERVLNLKPQGYILKSTTQKELNKTLRKFFKE